MTTDIRRGDRMVLVAGSWPRQVVAVAAVDGDGSVEAPTGVAGALEWWSPNGRRRGGLRTDTRRLVPPTPALLTRLSERLLWEVAGRLATELEDATTHGLPPTGEALVAFVDHLRAAREMLDTRAQATLAVDACGRPLYAPEETP